MRLFNFIAISCIGCAIVYLIFAFIKADINFVHWFEYQRETVAFLFFTVIILSAFIAFGILREKAH